MIKNELEDPGIANAMSESTRIYFLATGHNHGNDYCCHYRNTTLQLCFGRHSGYGGYGRWDRGSRIYELTIPFHVHDDDDDNTTRVDGVANDDDDYDDPSATTHNIHNMEWKTWVRLESGEIIDRVDTTRN